MSKGRKDAGVLLRKSRDNNWLLPAIFLLLTGTIAVSGYVYYQKQKKAVIHEQTTQLKAIADLKAVQIRDWLQERTGDARLIQQNPIMVAELAAFLGDRTRKDRRNAIQRWMASMRSNYHYENVMLLDRKGDVVLSANQHHAAIGSQGFRAMETALRNRDMALSDLHSDPKVPHIHLDLVAPILVGNEIIGCVFLRINPAVFLFPMIQSWPTPSPSAETLLVKREGENVLYLNELRHRQGAALTLSMPLRGTDLPAAQAILGKVGITAGHDYRGIRVRSVSRSIPDTPWFIVAKIDEEEITAPLRRSAQIIFSVALALIIATALVVLTLWRYQAARFQQRQLEAENQKRALEQHFDYLTRYANDIILLSDEKWHILEANERAMLAYGRNREDLLTMNLRDLRIPDERSKLAAEYKQTEKMLGAIFETWHLKKDGSIFPVEVSARVIAIDGKKYYQSIVRDISERKQAENALRESETFVRTVLDNLPIGVAVNAIDPNVTFSYMNDRFPLIYRTTREALAGRDAFWNAAYPDADFREKIKKQVLEDCASGDPARMVWTDIPLERPGGETVYITAMNVPIPNKAMMISLVWDVSDQKRAELALRESEEKFKHVFETANVGKSITQLNGEIDVNQAFCEMLGYSPQELRHKKWQELTPADEIESVQKILEPLLKGELDSTRFNKGYIHKDGSHIWGDLSVAIQRDPTGKPLHFITTVVDITERKRGEAQIMGQLQELQRWQDAMLDREDRVRELKDEVNELCRRAGAALRYSSQKPGPTAPGIVADPDTE